MEVKTKNTRIFRMKDLPEITGLQPSTIYEQIAAGKFPKPFKLTSGGRAAGWFDTTIYNYLTAQADSKNLNNSK
jgi:predicted DNA-binding transcriptional regulator AlpA|tara:strand:- start:701 stop:922 length:222 start_codon:yes stop_codon:yes gene_type:complete